MTYVDSRAARKERGAFFTPEPLARFIADWALRAPSDRVLEPACGEAVFLHCAASRLAALGAPPTRDQLLGVDLHEASIRRAQDSLQTAGIEARLTVSDFFDYQAPSPVDAVIGNPPYIRYQDFHGEIRAKALRASLTQGVRLTSLASSWAAFTVHAASFLTEGGRLGLVLPAELLSVNYASEVREFLLRSFTRVRLVLFTNRVFPDVQEEVVLLLAEDYTKTGPGIDHFELVQLAGVEALTSAPQVSRWTPASPGDKWTPALSTCPEYDVAVSPANGVFTELKNWGRVTLGAVTGANRFFALTVQRANELGLTDEDIVPLSPPGSRHLRDLVLDITAVHTLAEADKPTVLFSPAREPSAAAWVYISAGEATDVHRAYKCRVRTPWWRVPMPPTADLFVTYMNDTTVAFCANDARVHHLNSVHGLVLAGEAQRIDRDVLALAATNSVTGLGAEFIGRAYGGGLLKLEPREAGRLPVPEIALISRHERSLKAMLPHARTLLGRGEDGNVRREVDAILGLDALVGEDGLAAIHNTHDRLIQRRRARAGRRA